jgi:CBS domain containing-hemolysin-like protein
VRFRRAVSRRKGTLTSTWQIPAWQWTMLAVGLAASAFFSAAETALTALGEARVSALVDEGGRGALLKLWKNHPERVLTALLLGNTLVNVSMGSLTAIMAVEAGFHSSVALVTGATTFALLVFGEVTPKTFAKRYASAMATLLMPLVAVVYVLLWPLVMVLVQFPRALTFLARMSPEAPVESVTTSELSFLIQQGARHGSLDKEKEALLNSVLAFTEVLVKEIMVPRTQVVALEQSATYDEVMKVVTESELSRIPVYRETMDEITGVLYVKLLLSDLKKSMPPAQFQLARYVKKPFFVPEVMKVSRLLTEMQRRKTHLAVVVDEFGGTSGIVTLEDVVEEIVGEIHDETDVEEKQLKVLSDGVVLADAQVSIRDLEEHLGVEFPEDGDYETLGGFLTAIAGRVPPSGSLVVWDGLTFTVKLADERRVLKVEIAKKPAERHAEKGDRPERAPRIDGGASDKPQRPEGTPDKPLAPVADKIH